MKLTAMSREVFDHVKKYGKVSIAELASVTGRTERSVGANVTDLKKKALAVRVKETVEGEEDPVTYVVLTEEGMAFDPDAAVDAE